MSSAQSQDARPVHGSIPENDSHSPSARAGQTSETTKDKSPEIPADTLNALKAWIDVVRELLLETTIPPHAINTVLKAWIPQRHHHAITFVDAASSVCDSSPPPLLPLSSQTTAAALHPHHQHKVVDHGVAPSLPTHDKPIPTQQPAFHRFKYLPAELRLAIWEFAAASTSPFHQWPQGFSKDCINGPRRYMPIVALACKEAWDVVSSSGTYYELGQTLAGFIGRTPPRKPSGAAPPQFTAARFWISSQDCVVIRGDRLFDGPALALLRARKSVAIHYDNFIKHQGAGYSWLLDSPNLKTLVIVMQARTVNMRSDLPVTDEYKEARKHLRPSSGLCKLVRFEDVKEMNKIKRLWNGFETQSDWIRDPLKDVMRFLPAGVQPMGINPNPGLTVGNPNHQPLVMNTQPMPRQQMIAQQLQAQQQAQLQAQQHAQLMAQQQAMYQARQAQIQLQLQAQQQAQRQAQQRARQPTMPTQPPTPPTQQQLLAQLYAHRQLMMQRQTQDIQQHLQFERRIREQLWDRQQAGPQANPADFLQRATPIGGSDHAQQRLLQSQISAARRQMSQQYAALQQAQCHNCDPTTTWIDCKIQRWKNGGLRAIQSVWIKMRAAADPEKLFDTEIFPDGAESTESAHPNINMEHAWVRGVLAEMPAIKPAVVLEIVSDYRDRVIDQEQYEREQYFANLVKCSSDGRGLPMNAFRGG